MLQPIEGFTLASQLWRFPEEPVPLERDGETWSCRLNGGLSLSCTIRQEGELFHRIDTVRNDTDAPLSCGMVEARFLFEGGRHEVYTQASFAQMESQGCWNELSAAAEASCSSNRTSNGAAPMLGLWSVAAERGVVFHLIPASTWCIRASKRPVMARVFETEVTVGFGGEVTLQPGESVRLPEILYFTFRRKLDLDAWKLHRWFHDYQPKKPMSLTFNSWMYRFDAFTPEGLLQQVDEAAALGLEYFVIDAGWFGPNGVWSLTVGSWTESAESATQGRMHEIADRVRARGMQFGLWVEPERAAPCAPILQTHPEYYIKRDRGDYQLDFRREDARAYLLDVLERLIADYGIRWFKFDCNREYYAQTGDRCLTDYYRGCDEFLRVLRERHPEIHIEGCASGGQRMNLYSATRYDSIWVTDEQSLVFGMDIYKGTIIRMPPQVLERWAVVQDLPNSSPYVKAPFTYDHLMGCESAMWNYMTTLTPSWLDGFLLGSPMGFSCDLTKLTPEHREHLAKLVARYRSEREFWQSAECHILTDTPELLVLQYNDRDFTQVHIMTYARRAHQKFVTVYPILPDGKEQPVRIALDTYLTFSETVL